MTILPAHRHGDPPGDPPTFDAEIVELFDDDQRAAAGGRLADADQLPDDDDPASDLEPYRDAWRPSATRTRLERVLARPLPTRRQMAASARWWAGAGAAVLPHLVVKALPVLFAQIRPTFRGFGKLLNAWSAWRVKADWLVDARQAEGTARAKARERYERRKRARSMGSTVGFGVLLLVLLIGSVLWPAWTLVTLFAVVGALDWWGHDTRKGEGVVSAVLPAAPLAEGAPLRVIIPQVDGVLRGRGHEPTIVNPTIGEFGVTMDVHSQQEVDDKDLEALERGLGSFPGSVSQVRSRENAAVTGLRLMWKDPLARMGPPPLWLPLSQTVNSPGDMGYGLGATPLLLNFLRTNILVVGGPGSGKSSAFWDMADYLTSCHDVVIDGIDLSGGPALTAWGDCIRNFASTPKEAEDLLLYALDLADRRTRKIAGRSRPQRGGPPVGSENFGTADGLAHIILIDELPLLAAIKPLLELYSEHQRVGRKAASTSIAATQDLGGDTIKATSVRKYPSTTVLLPCSREDVTIALGGGKIKEGWAPHRFVPAEGDDVNDAGKCFIHSGRHKAPNPWRFNRLDDMGAIHKRALDRIDAGRPELDDDHSGAVDGFVLPEALAMMHAAFTAAAWPDFMATEDIRAAIAAERATVPTAARLAEMVKEFGLAPDPTRRRSGAHPNPRSGYLSDAVQLAIRRAEERERGGP